MNFWKTLLFVGFFVSIFAISADAATQDLVPTSCLINAVSDTACQSAISVSGGSTYSLAKGSRIDALLPSAGIASNSTINSLTLYFRTSGTLSGTYRVGISQDIQGTTFCQQNPAPENGSLTLNSYNCTGTVSVSQLNNTPPLYLYIVNEDDKSPESETVDYVYFHIDYTTPTPTPTPTNTPTPTPSPTPVLSISLSTDGTVNFGTIGNSASQNTTASGTNDVQTVTVNAGPANINISTSNFAKTTPTTNTWTLGSSPGTNVCKYEYSTNGSSWSTFLLPSTNYTLCSNVAQSSTCSVYLRLTTPSVNSVYGAYSADVTLTAVAP